MNSERVSEAGTKGWKFGGVAIGMFVSASIAVGSTGREFTSHNRVDAGGEGQTILRALALIGALASEVCLQR